MSDATASTLGGGRPGFRFEPGARLAGRYVVVRGLGRGGMGEVYQVEDTQLGEVVALKTLSERLSAQPAALSRFQAEVKNARRIGHANVCRTYDFGVHGEGDAAVHFLTMELLVGETLDARMGRTKLDRGEILELFGQIAGAVDAAHAVGIVHRDLKPSNVMLVSHSGGGTRAVVTDFGLARQIDESRITREGWVGTPAYVAPEQLEGEAGGPAVDVYALGVMLFEAVTGRLPFEGGSGPQVALQRLARPAPRARTVDPILPAPWDEAIARCLEQKPEQRYRKASDAVRAMAGEAVAAESSWSTGPGGPARRARWVAAGLVGLAVVGAATAVVIHRKRAPAGLPASRVVAVSVALAPGAKGPELPKEFPPFNDAAAYVIREQWTRLEEKRRFRVSPGASGNVEARVKWAPKGPNVSGSVDVVVAGATLAHFDGEAPSIRELAIALFPQVSEYVGQDQPTVELFPEEREEMVRWGAPDAQAYKDLKRVFSDLWREFTIEVTSLEAELDDLLRRHPGWPHAALARVVQLGCNTDAARALAARTLGLAPAGIDPLARKALEQVAAGWNATHAMGGVDELPPVPDIVLDDAILGFMPTDDDAAAGMHLMAERHPALQWTGALNAPPEAHPGWHARAPGNRQAWLSSIARIAIDSTHDLGQVVAVFQRLHGDLPQTRLPIASAYLARFDTGAITALQPALLATSATLRGYAMYLLAQAAVFNGRLTLAREKFLAAEDFARTTVRQDVNFPWVQTQRELQRLELVLGNRSAAREHEEQLAQLWDAYGWTKGAPSAFLWEVRQARSGGCPSTSAADHAEAGPADLREALRLRHRAARLAGCLSCEAVLADGPSPNEAVLPWTDVYARCATELGRDLDEALGMLRTADHYRSLMLTNCRDPSSVDVILAHYWMGRVLEKQGKLAEARAKYERFLKFWGAADVPIAEVDDARRRLLALGRP